MTEPIHKIFDTPCEECGTYWWCEHHTEEDYGVSAAYDDGYGGALMQYEDRM